jgi:hypothetical protein
VPVRVVRALSRDRSTRNARSNAGQAEKQPVPIIGLTAAARAYLDDLIMTDTTRLTARIAGATACSEELKKGDIAGVEVH